jgi:hypothetical protein
VTAVPVENDADVLGQPGPVEATKEVALVEPVEESQCHF